MKIKKKDLSFCMGYRVMLRLRLDGEFNFFC